LALSLLSLYRWPASTVNHPRKTPRLSFFALQHFRNQRPFFSLLLLEKRLGTVALIPKSPTPRVWLPSRRPLALQSLGGLFQPPTLLGFALQSFPPLEWSVLRFHSTPSLPHSPTKPPGLVPVPQRLCPTQKPCPFLPPEILRRGETSCSLGLSDLSGSPSAYAR
jgi:hypothetical protein